MKTEKTTRTRSVAFLLQGLMLFFIVCSSWTSVNARPSLFDGHLKIRSLVADQIIFRDSNLTESVSNTLDKLHLQDCVFVSNPIDISCSSVAVSEALLIAHSTFNPFYHHITINAP